VNPCQRLIPAFEVRPSKGRTGRTNVDKVVHRLVSTFATAVALMVLSATWTPASAQSVLNIWVSPTNGQAGQSFAVSWSLAGNPCAAIAFSWPLGPIPSSPSPPTAAGAVTVLAPAGSKAGTYTITAACGDYSAQTRYTVLAAPTTTPPPVTTTTRPPVTTTRPPVTTTTTRRTTTTTTPPVTTTTDSMPPSTTVAPSIDTTVPITDVPEPVRDLVFDRDAIQPGDSAQAVGKGCTPNGSVELVSAGETVGSATADDQGRFTAKIQFSRIEPGRHLIAAECGILLTGTIDQLITSSTGGSSSTLVVLVFFVLAGAALIRFT